MRRFTNIALLRSSGRDLTLFRDPSFDLVHAVDTFPYLVLSGGDFAERHMRDIARVLRPRGTLLVLNYSYSGSIERDRREVAAGARAVGLQVVRDGTRDFTTWDAVTFQMDRAL